MKDSKNKSWMRPTHKLLLAGSLLLATVTTDSAVAQELKLKLDLTPPPQERNRPQLQLRMNGSSTQQPQPKTLLALPEQAEATEEELAQVAFDLTSPEFAKRKSASVRLKTLPLVQLRELALRMEDAPSAEAVVRVHSELELRYQSESLEERKNASQLLERMAKQDRLLAADPANHSLQKYWQTRIEVALAELEAMGAIVKNGNFSNPAIAGLPPDPRPAIQVLLTESWRGGNAGLKNFERLEALAGPMRSLKGIQVYLLTGHTLAEEHEKQLIDIIGANRIQRRSRVALGITGDRGTQGVYEGILIKGVSRGGSADRAGLETGDFILSMYDADEQVPLMEFDPESWRVFRPRMDRRLLPPDPNRNQKLGPPNPDQDNLRGAPGEPLPVDDPDGAESSAHRLLDFDQLVERLKKYKPGAKVKLQVVKDFQRVNPLWAFPNVPRGVIPDPEDGKASEAKKVIEVEVELIGWENLPMVR